MYPKQLAAIFDPRDVYGQPARVSYIEASTKSGKTVGSAMWLVERALLDQGRGHHRWWVAPVYPQALIAFDRLKRALSPKTYHARESPPTIRLLHNDNTIWFKSGEDPDNLYGEDVYDAVLDEASRMRAESAIAVQTTLTATSGSQRIIGNVKGRRNWFFEAARKAEASLSGDGEPWPWVSYSKIISADAVAAGVLLQEDIEIARRGMPEAAFRELYEAEPSDDEGNPFGFSHIKACVGPMSLKRPVAFGVDLAKKQDWTVVTGVDEDGAVCKFDRFQQPWPDTVRRVKITVGRTPALVDSTGVGDPIVDYLQKDFGNNFAGYFFTAPSKQKLMEGLAVAIQGRETMYPDRPDVPIRKELDNFEYVATRTSVHYSAPEGAFDDCVCSLALAVECKKQNTGMESWRRLGRA